MLIREHDAQMGLSLLTSPVSCQGICSVSKWLSKISQSMANTP